MVRTKWRFKVFVLLLLVCAAGLGGLWLWQNKARNRSQLVALIKSEMQQHGARGYVPLTRGSQEVTLTPDEAMTQVLPFIESAGYFERSPLVATASDGISIEVEIDQKSPIRIRFVPSGQVFVYIEKYQPPELWIGSYAWGLDSGRNKLDLLRRTLKLEWPQFDD